MENRSPISKTGSEKIVYFRILSVILFTVGGVLFVDFFSSVDKGMSINVLFVSVALLSLSAFTAATSVREDSTNLHFVFVLYAISLLLLLMGAIRFQVLSGRDILFEYRTARTTYEQGVWSLARSPFDRYFSAVSISLTPPVLQEISGVSILALFQYIYPMISAMLPILLFLTVKEGFGNSKLAAVAAVLFAETNFNFTLLSGLIRQQIAEVFLLLAFFVLFKLESNKLGSKNKKAFTVLLIIFMFGIVSSHYTIDYFLMPIFLIIFIFGLLVSYFPRNFRSLFGIDRSLNRTVVTLSVLVLFLVLSFVWVIGVYYSNFIFDVQNEFRTVLSPITQLQYEVTFAVTGGPTAGKLVTYWFDLTAALSAVGLLYMSLRIRKDVKNISWMVAGLVMLCVTALWIIPSVSSSGVYIDRVYTIGVIFFTTFVAFVLLEIDKRIHHRGVGIVLLLFLLLNLPINMYLPSNSNQLLYHTKEAVPPDAGILQGLPTVPDFAMATWADEHTFANETFVVNTLGAISVFYVDGNINEVSNPNIEAGNYLVLDYYNLRYNLWRNSSFSSEEINAAELMASGSVFYNNGEAALVSQK